MAPPRVRAEDSSLRATMLPFSFKAAIGSSAPASFEYCVEGWYGTSWTSLTEAARDRGGLGGGVFPICESTVNEFMLWHKPWTKITDRQTGRRADTDAGRGGDALGKKGECSRG
jgi:hypothetical protein